MQGGEFQQRGEEGGQAAVEASLVIPMMLFFILGIVQLGLMHQAQLMTEYAAYRAARAGIVQDGDCTIMRKAALVGVLPTILSGVAGGPRRTDTLARGAFAYGIALVELNGPTPYNHVKVEVLNPSRARLNGLFNNYGSHLQRKELDFDDIRDNTVIEANLLTVRVTYYYKMVIPFANTLIHSFWMATEVGGAMALGNQKGIQFENTTYNPTDRGASGGIAMVEAAGLAGNSEVRSIALAATAFGKYYIPIRANYSMRMQSNLFINRVNPCAI